jgi:hypothetical protein
MKTFIEDITFDELRLLRKVVRRVLMKERGTRRDGRYPMHLLNDTEADKIIESLGPTVREHMIRNAVGRYGMGGDLTKHGTVRKETRR